MYLTMVADAVFAGPRRRENPLGVCWRISTTTRSILTDEFIRRCVAHNAAGRAVCPQLVSMMIDGRRPGKRRAGKPALITFTDPSDPDRTWCCEPDETEAGVGEGLSCRPRFQPRWCRTTAVVLVDHWRSAREPVWPGGIEANPPWWNGADNPAGGHFGRRDRRLAKRSILERDSYARNDLAKLAPTLPECARASARSVHAATRAASIMRRCEITPRFDRSARWRSALRCSLPAVDHWLRKGA